MFSRQLEGGTDIQSNANRDLIWVTMHGFSDTVMDYLRNDANLDRCLEKVQIGVLIPGDGVEHDYDHARCVGEQKLVGF